MKYFCLQIFEIFFFAKIFTRTRINFYKKLVNAKASKHTPRVYGCANTEAQDLENRQFIIREPSLLVAGVRERATAETCADLSSLFRFQLRFADQLLAERARGERDWNDRLITKRCDAASRLEPTRAAFTSEISIVNICDH